VQNAAINATNSGAAAASASTALQVAWLRHLACQLLHGSHTPLLTRSQQQQLLGFCLKVRGA
jgi:hypothetical protein